MGSEIYNKTLRGQPPLTREICDFVKSQMFYEIDFRPRCIFIIFRTGDFISCRLSKQAILKQWIGRKSTLRSLSLACLTSFGRKTAISAALKYFVLPLQNFLSSLKILAPLLREARIFEDKKLSLSADVICNSRGRHSVHSASLHFRKFFFCCLR